MARPPDAARRPTPLLVEVLAVILGRTATSFREVVVCGHPRLSPCRRQATLRGLVARNVTPAESPRPSTEPSCRRRPAVRGPRVDIGRPRPGRVGPFQARRGRLPRHASQRRHGPRPLALVGKVRRGETLASPRLTRLGGTPCYVATLDMRPAIGRDRPGVTGPVGAPSVPPALQVTTKLCHRGQLRSFLRPVSGTPADWQGEEADLDLPLS